jgi:subtilisin family serine protease
VLPAWKQGAFGTGVVVAIVDDGVEYRHPDLSRQFVQLALIL